MSFFKSLLNYNSLTLGADELTISGITTDTLLYTNTSNQLASASVSSPLEFKTGTLSLNTSTLLSGLTTDNLTEGKTNLYYTDARFDSRLATKTTTNLTEGSNLYYTDVRFDSRLATKTTTDLTEGSNLYYTDARFDSRLATKTTTNLTEGSNLYYTDGRFDTRLATKTTTNLTEGSNLYYTDGRFDSRLATKTTTNLTEGSNLYYTDARARAALSAGTGISYNNTTGVISTSGLVTSITGTANQITASAATGAVTLSVPSLLQITDLRLGKAAFNRPVTSNIISFGSSHQAAGGFTCVNFDTSHFIGSTTTSGGGLLVNARCGFVCPDGTGGAHTAVVIGGSKSGTGTPATATGLNVSCPALGATIGVGVIADSVSIGTGAGWTDATTANGRLRVSGAIGVGVNPGSSSIRINALTANTLVRCDANKELVSLAVGTTSQYLRGDDTWQTLNQAAVTGLTTASTPSFAGVNLGSGSINLSNYDTTTGANGLSYGGGIATVTWRIVRIGGMCFFSWANVEMPSADNTISIATATLTPTSAFLPSTTRSYTFTTPNVNGTGALYIGNLSLTVTNSNITIAWRPNGFDSSHKWWNNGSTPIINSGSVCYHIL